MVEEKKYCPLTDICNHYPKCDIFCKNYWDCTVYDKINDHFTDSLETRICNIEACLDKLFDKLKEKYPDDLIIEESWALLSL